MTPDNTVEESGVFFGLRSEVELFRDPQSAQAMTRAKEAALLYDRVILEVGLLDVVVGKEGGTSFWIPPDQIDDQMRARAREPIEIGAPFSLALGAQADVNTPAPPEAMQTIVSSTVTRGYVAEYHTGILDETEALGLDWVEGVYTPNTFPTDTRIGKAIRDANWRDWTDKSLLQEKPTFERDLIYKSFNHDLFVAADLGTTLTVTPLFEPMIGRHALKPDRSGGTALSILVPNLSRVPWEGIAEFREHPGCEEARLHLREFEQRASEGAAEDAFVYLQGVAREVSRAYMMAVEDLRTNLGSELTEEAIKTGVSLIPAVGPIVEKAASLGEIAYREARERRSWTSAIFKLSQRARPVD